ncbi:MAG TPA: tryptophan synthase subunit alpha [Candidatus Brocadiia bacterium]|nr:tryptophan synthase subunit alpha [Candidatus Brocadiia bacterium]
MNRIDLRFQELRRKREPAFIPYLTAGDPDMHATRELILEAERRGADLIELGVPFSDPIADGPVIQASHLRALEGGTRVGDVLAMVREVRNTSEIPIVAMISCSIVFRKGADGFIRSMAEAGIDGATIPDLPVEEAGQARDAADRAGLHLAPFVTPTTTIKRQEAICRAARGFIYYISVVGLTGAREQLAGDLKANVDRIRAAAKVPVAVGFGVSRPEHAREVGAVSDGVIVGSALVRLISENAGAGIATLRSRFGDAVGQLSSAAKQR